MADDKIIITPEQAIDCLPAGATVHNFMQGGMALIGCDYGREEAERALHEADSIEIAGPMAKQMKHAIVAHKDGDFSFFESDMTKIEALETASQQEG